MAIKNKSKLPTLKKIKGGILPFLFIFFLAGIFFPASFSYADISETGHFQKTFFKFKNGIEKKFNGLDPYFEKTKSNASKNSKNKKPENIYLELTQDIPALKPVKYLTAKLTSLEQANENKTEKEKEKIADKNHIQTLSATSESPAALASVKTKTENIFSGFLNKIKNGFLLSEKNISNKIYGYQYQRAYTYTAFNPKKAKRETQIIARAELAKDQIKSIADIYESLNKEKTAKNFKVEGFVQNSRKISDPLLQRISDLEIKFLELKLKKTNNSTDLKSASVKTSEENENFNLRLDELNKAISDKATELRKEIQASASANLSVISLTNKISQLHQPTISAPNISSPVISAPTVSGNSNLETLTTSGLATLNSLSVSGNAALNSTLSVTATTTLYGDLRADTSTLVLDALNNRLGVGTTSPQSLFSVAGIILFGEVSATSTNIGNENISQNLIVNRNFEVTGESTFSTFHSSAAGTSTISGILLANSTSTFASQLISNRIPNTPHSFSSWASGAENSQVQNSSFYINPASATGDTNLFGAAINDSVRFLIDAEGDVFANSITLVGGSTLSTTSISTLTVENSANLGDAANADSHIFKGVINLYATSSNSALSIWNSSTGDLLSLSGGATAPENHLTLTSGGNLGLGTSSPYAKLSVNGEAVASYFTATSTAATSTFSGGFFVGSTTNPFLMVDRNTGNVGIGTLTPNAKLNIASGNILLDNNQGYYIKDTGGTGRYAILVNTDNDLALGNSSFRHTSIYGGNSGNIFFTTGGSEKMRIVGSSGNLGIGTTTPNWLLQANGTRPSFVLSDSSSAANLKHWFMSSQGGNFYVGTSSDAYATSTISALTINSNSTVGIGTTTPFEKFAVQGGLAADYLTITGAVNATSTFSTGGLNIGNGQFVVQQTSGKLGINTPVTGSQITATTTLSAATGNEVAYQLNYTTSKAAGNDTGLLINMTDTASPETSNLLDLQVGGISKWKVTNSGAVIGLDAVQAPSFSNADTNSSVSIGINTTGATANLFKVQMAPTTLTMTSGSNGAVKIVPTYNQTSGTAANTDLLINRTETAVGNGLQLLQDWQVGGNSKMVINNQGQLGIGTTTPNWLLQANGTRPSFVLSDSSSDANLKHWFMSSQGGNLYLGTSSDAYATSTISALTINSNSTVGIGTTTPFEKFSVQGGIGADYLTITGATNATSTFSAGGINVGNGQFVVQQTSGNVGIGTAGPNALLHVNGATDQIFIGDRTDTTTDGLSGFRVLAGSGSTKDIYIDHKTDDDGFLHYRVGAGAEVGSTHEFMTVNAETGNIGIGTTTPNWLLQANGTRPSFVLSDSSSAANLKHWFMSSQGGNFYVGTSSDAYATSTISALTINSNSTVGIGTTTPFEKFAVQGGLAADYLTITGAVNATSTFSTGGLNIGNGQFVVQQTSGKLGINTPVTGSQITATTTLSAATGNEVAYQLNYTTNKAAGNDTGLLINMTDTNSPGTSNNLLDLQVGGSSKFNVDNSGTLTLL